jgi:two-component system cell cycle sensor histidine kinase/response regulator CckA
VIGILPERTEEGTMAGKVAENRSEIGKNGIDLAQQYRLLVDNMLNAYALHEIICDQNGAPVDYRFLDVNAAFERLTGLSANALVGHTVLQVLPQTEPAWIETYGRVALTGEPAHFEDFSRELDRYYEVIAFRPAPNQFACSFTDITERKKAELALLAAKEEVEQGREYLESIINNIGDPVFVKDEQSRLLLVNDAFCTVFGLARDKILGKTLAEDVPPDEREHFLAIDRQVIADGRESIVEERLTVRGAPTKIIMTRKSRFIDSSGKKYLIGIIRDISDRKQAEMSLAAEKEQLAVTLRSIGDGVITTDTAGNIVMLNRAAEQLTGWPADEAVGRPLPEVFHIVHQHTRRRCRNPVEKVLARNQTVELANNTCLIAKDGRERVIADSGAPIRDNEGAIIGVVIVFRDTTEKQKLAEYMQRSQKLESLGVLAGGLAHDFNNLLGAIFGYTEIAIARSKDPAVAGYLTKSIRNIDRARALTQQLLTFAKGGAPKRSIGELYALVQETVRFTLSGTAVPPQFYCQEGVWPCYFDPHQIGQVIENIVINAQQAMPHGGRVEVSLQNATFGEKEHVSLAAGDYVRLSIKDHGTGISPEHIPNIFDPYFTTKNDGHGLGLATCYSIINRHDGWIDVESELGEGSTFHIYLPATDGPVPKREKKPAIIHQGSGTFLVMDDEKAMREVLQEILTAFGYTAVTTKSGAEAINFCTAAARANRSPVAMIFDLTVTGGMGGKEAIAEIRKIFPNVPAFVASGYSEDPVIANPQEYGFQASLGKPFTIQQLSDMLNKHIGNG